MANRKKRPKARKASALEADPETALHAGRVGDDLHDAQGGLQVALGDGQAQEAAPQVPVPPSLPPSPSPAGHHQEGETEPDARRGPLGGRHRHREGCSQGRRHVIPLRARRPLEALAERALGLGEADKRALAILRRGGAMTCARLGEALWGRTGKGNCSCPWARPAGKLLHRLRRLGLVRREATEHHTLWSAA
jgi:hypothetical protein